MTIERLISDLRREEPARKPELNYYGGHKNVQPGTSKSNRQRIKAKLTLVPEVPLV